MPATTGDRAMTPEQRATLIDLAAEYGGSLARVDDEKNFQKTIAGRAQREGGIKTAHFVRLATALHKDTVALERAELDTLGDWFALVLGEEKP
jgi:acyl-CoA hydrolase